MTALVKVTVTLPFSKAVKHFRLKPVAAALYTARLAASGVSYTVSNDA